MVLGPATGTRIAFMAEPELPPWLTQQADPIGAVYKGVQTGGAIAGVLNQRNVIQSRLRLEQQEQQMNHLRMEKAIKDRDDIFEADLIMQAVPDKIAPLLEAGKPSDARNVLLSLAARKPAVLNSDTFANLLKSVEAAVQTETTRLQLESMNWRAELSADTRLEIAQAKAALDNDPNSLVAQQRLLRAYMQMEGLQQGRERIGIAKENLGLRELGARQAAVNIESRLAESGQAPAVPLAPSGTLPPGPGGVQPATGLVVPATRPLTTANATVNQEALSSALSGIRQASLLKPLINSGTFGPRAFVESKLIDKFFANAYPELLNKDRVAASVMIAQLRGATARAIRSDSNITKDEQQSIASTIPGNDKFFTSPAEAMVQLETINRGIVDRAIRAARNLKQPVPDDLAPFVPGDMLPVLLRERLMTPQQAEQWYQQNRSQ